MDAPARNKALFRAKLNAQKKDKRLDSPLVRYNEFDQPVCRVCDVVLKSESQWDAHQASRKHHEAIKNLKANAAGRTQTSYAKSEPHVESSKVENALKNEQREPSTKLPTVKQSGLPPNFFDNHGTERQKIENKMDGGSVIQGKTSQPSQQLIQKSTHIAGTETKQVKKALPEGFFDKDEAALPSNGVKPAEELLRTSAQVAAPETKQVKGALPEGFFDNQEADLRARGIKPVKIDVKDEYKEFERLIQEDLQEVDDRMEEEEIDAAEMIEEAESLEQKAYRERVEMLRKRKLELKATKLAKRVKDTKVESKESSDEESSSDDDTDENFAVDWRAQHL